MDTRSRGTDGRFVRPRERAPHRSRRADGDARKAAARRRGIAPIPLGGARQSDLCPIDSALIAARRWELDLTQAQVSARSQRAIGYIGQLEGGQVRHITLETLEALARAGMPARRSARRRGQR